MTQGDFDNLVSTLRLTVSLEVVRCRNKELSAQDLKEGCPELSQEDLSTVRDNFLWYAPVTIIVFEEGVCPLDGTSFLTSQDESDYFCQFIGDCHNRIVCSIAILGRGQFRNEIQGNHLEGVVG